MVFVVLKHADTVLDDEEEVDPSQRCEALPHSVKGCYEIGVMVRPRFAVVVLPLRLWTGKEQREMKEKDGSEGERHRLYFQESHRSNPWHLLQVSEKAAQDLWQLTWGNRWRRASPLSVPTARATRKVSRNLKQAWLRIGTSTTPSRDSRLMMVMDTKPQSHTHTAQRDDRQYLDLLYSRCQDVKSFHSSGDEWKLSWFQPVTSFLEETLHFANSRSFSVIRLVADFSRPVHVCLKASSRFQFTCPCDDIWHLKHEMSSDVSAEVCSPHFSVKATDVTHEAGQRWS